MAAAAPPPPPKEGSDATTSPGGKKERARVVWDEKNLKENAEWQAAHPVTMKIDEPKTPYNHDDGEYSEEDDEGGIGEPKHVGDSRSGWADAAYNHLATRARHEASGALRGPSTDVAVPAAAATDDAPPRKRAGVALPALATAPVDEAAAERAEREREHEFRHMRKAVYADEGAKFKALLAKGAKCQVDSDEEDDDKKDADGDE